MTDSELFQQMLELLDTELPTGSYLELNNALQARLAQPKQEPGAWPCEIEEADFEQDTITLKMLTSEYVVRAGKHWLSTTPPAAPVQEPCGWQFYQDGKWHNGMETSNHKANTEDAGIPVRNVYPPAAPAAQRTWVGLTDEEIYELFEDGLGFEKPRSIYLEIEAKLKEKNT
jgi:hypothetical protein